MIETLFTFTAGLLRPLRVDSDGVVAQYGTKTFKYPIPAGTPSPATHSAPPVGAVSLPPMDYNLPLATQRVGDVVAGVAYKTPFRSNMDAVGFAFHEPTGSYLYADPAGFDGFIPQRLSLSGRYMAGTAVRRAAEGLPSFQSAGVVDMLTGEFLPLEGVLGAMPFGPLAWGEGDSFAVVAQSVESTGAVYRLVHVTGWEG